MNLGVSFSKQGVFGYSVENGIAKKLDTIRQLLSEEEHLKNCQKIAYTISEYNGQFPLGLNNRTKIPFACAIITGAGIKYKTDQKYVFISFSPEDSGVIRISGDSVTSIYDKSFSYDELLMRILRNVFIKSEQELGCSLVDKTLRDRFVSNKQYVKICDELLEKCSAAFSQVTETKSAKITYSVFLDKINENRTICYVLTQNEIKNVFKDILQIIISFLQAESKDVIVVADRRLIDSALGVLLIDAVRQDIFPYDGECLGDIAAKGCAVLLNSHIPYIDDRLTVNSYGVILKNRYYEIIPSKEKKPCKKAVRFNLPVGMTDFKIAERYPDGNVKVITILHFEVQDFRINDNNVVVQMELDDKELIQTIFQESMMTTLTNRSLLCNSNNKNIYVLFLIDTSSSVQEPIYNTICQKIGYITQEYIRYCSERGISTHFAAICCANKAETVHTFENDISLLRNKIQRNKYGKQKQYMSGQTNMVDAVKKAIELFPEESIKNNEKKLCVVFTDGCFDNPMETIAQFHIMKQTHHIDAVFVHCGYAPQDVIYRIVCSDKSTDNEEISKYIVTLDELDNSDVLWSFITCTILGGTNA